jgi:hypothetical protein
VRAEISTAISALGGGSESAQPWPLGRGPVGEAYGVTFHLALVTASFVLQTGDRLLTLEQGSSGPSPWDPYANKTILLLARNGTVAISYSGLSYIRDIPTDRWLAETIAGPTIDFRGAPAMRFGGPPVDIGPALNAVRAAIEREFAILPRRRQQLHLLISGWTWRRRPTDSRQPRPLMGTINHHGDYSAPPNSNFLPRYWEWHRQLKTACIGAQPRSHLDGMLNALAQTGHRNPDDTEELMVAVIRGVADEPDEPTVGKDCMSILISRSQEIRVRYLRDPGWQEPIRTAYTPWIIGGGIVAPPSLLQGTGFSVNAGGRAIPIESLPPLPENGLRSFSGQLRPKFP